MKIVVAIGGASGSIYAKVLLDKLQGLGSVIERVGVIMSDNAKFTWTYELDNKNYKQYPFDFYATSDFMAPFASGSAKYDSMIVCPCSMGFLGRVASGISTDLASRAADVILKEKRRLILVLRETPFNHIHISNMLKVSEAGGIICPANPSFYSKPADFEALAATVIDRALQLVGLETGGFKWGE